jgi:hypothetical protein
MRLPTRAVLLFVSTFVVAAGAELMTLAVRTHPEWGGDGRHSEEPCVSRLRQLPTSVARYISHTLERDSARTTLTLILPRDHECVELFGQQSWRVEATQEALAAAFGIVSIGETKIDGRDLQRAPVLRTAESGPVVVSVLVSRPIGEAGSFSIRPNVTRWDVTDSAPPWIPDSVLIQPGPTSVRSVRPTPSLLADSLIRYDRKALRDGSLYVNLDLPAGVRRIAFPSAREFLNRASDAAGSVTMPAAAWLALLLPMLLYVWLQERSASGRTFARRLRDETRPLLAAGALIIAVGACVQLTEHGLSGVVSTEIQRWIARWGAVIHRRPVFGDASDFVLAAALLLLVPSLLVAPPDHSSPHQRVQSIRTLLSKILLAVALVGVAALTLHASGALVERAQLGHQARAWKKPDDLWDSEWAFVIAAAPTVFVLVLCGLLGARLALFSAPYRQTVSIGRLVEVALLIVVLPVTERLPSRSDVLDSRAALWFVVITGAAAGLVHSSAGLTSRILGEWRRLLAATRIAVDDVSEAQDVDDAQQHPVPTLGRPPLLLVLILSLPFGPILGDWGHVTSWMHAGNIAAVADLAFRLVLLVWLLAVVRFLEIMGSRRLVLAEEARLAGILAAAAVVFPLDPEVLGIPVTFVVGVAVLLWAIRRPGGVADIATRNELSTTERRDILQRLIESRVADAALRAYRKKRLSDLLKGDVNADDFVADISARRQRAEEWRERARVSSRPADELFFAFGPGETAWGNGLLGARYGLIAGAVWIVIGLTIVIRRQAHFMFPQWSLVFDSIMVILRWAGLGFTLGYFFAHIRGHSGLEKGALMALCVAVVQVPVALIAGGAMGAVSPAVVLSIQTFVSCVVIGVLLDARSVNNAGERDRRALLDAYGRPELGLSISTGVLAVAGALTATFSGEATKLLVEAVKLAIPAVTGSDVLQAGR